jgi:hypothetical protein
VGNAKRLSSVFLRIWRNPQISAPKLFPVLQTTTTMKVKVNLSLCLTEHCAMKAYGGVDVYIHIFLISTLVGDE